MAKSKISKGVVLSAVVAGIFAGSMLAKVARAEGDAKPAMDSGDKQYECNGANACKGKGACGGKGHSCAGYNECRGKGFTFTKDKAECDDVIAKMGKKGGKKKSEKKS